MQPSSRPRCTRTLATLVALHGNHSRSGRCTCSYSAFSKLCSASSCSRARALATLVALHGDHSRGERCTLAWLSVATPSSFSERLASLRFSGRWAPRRLSARLPVSLGTALSSIEPRPVGESARRACQHETNGVLFLAGLSARPRGRRPFFSRSSAIRALLLGS